MKKLCLILAALALSTGAFAQKMWVGGALDGTIRKNVSTLYIAPEFGYFLTDNISVEGGLGLGFGYEISNFQLNAAGRYWFSLTDDINYNPGVCLQLNHGALDVLGERVSNTAFDVLFQVGSFDYAVADNWSVRFNFCQISLNSLFNKPSAEFSIKTEGTVTIKYYF